MRSAGYCGFISGKWEGAETCHPSLYTVTDPTQSYQWDQSKQNRISGVVILTLKTQNTNTGFTTRMNFTLLDLKNRVFALNLIFCNNTSTLNTFLTMSEQPQTDVKTIVLRQYTSRLKLWFQVFPGITFVTVFDWTVSVYSLRVVWERLLWWGVPPCVCSLGQHHLLWQHGLWDSPAAQRRPHPAAGLQWQTEGGHPLLQRPGANVHLAFISLLLIGTVSVDELKLVVYMSKSAVCQNFILNLNVQVNCSVCVYVIMLFCIHISI